MKRKQKTDSLLRRMFSAVLVSTFVIGMLTGCSREMTPAKLMDEVSDNMADLQSFATAVEMNIEMEDVLRVTRVSMDMQMENTTDPRAGHALGTVHVSMQGNELSSSLEIYQSEEEERSVTYTSVDGNWSRSETEQASEEEAAAGGTLNTSFFQEIGNVMDTFRIAKQSVQIEGQECYQMYGEVTGKDLMGLLGTEMIQAYGLVEIPDEDAIAEMKIPITFDVYQEDMLPARMFVDMTDVMNQLYDSYNKSTKVNDFTIRLDFTEYDQVQEIIVPDEVRQNSGE